MKKEYLKVPYAIRYIGLWKEYQLPKGHCIVDKGVTGCGYTEFCLTNSENVVLCSPRKMLLESKARKHRDDLNIMYIENNIDDFSRAQSFETKVGEHIDTCHHFLGKPCKIMVTYDSCHRVIKVLKERGLLGIFRFVSDEFQSIFLDSYFKSEVELDFVTALQECPNVIYLSATPMLERHLDRLKEFKDLLMYVLDWSGSGYTESVTVKRKLVKSLITEGNKIIQDYLQGNYPVTLDKSGNVTYSTEAVLYFNSISDITQIIKKNKLDPGMVNILCSKSEDTKRKLERLTRELKDSIPEGSKFEVGQVPMQGEPNKMFTFCTSAVYMGIDLHSLCASTYVFADPNIDCLALDISLDLPQIAGRQRDEENPFKNVINLFYRIKRKGEKELTEEAFKELQSQRKSSTDILLREFSNMSEAGKKEYLKKLKDGIQLRKYSEDFVSISKLTGKPVENKLIEIANERAWEVSQKDYQDKISVTCSLEKEGFEADTYKDENDRIASEFLDNYFYKTGLFSEKMKMYCEFVDYYKDNLEIMDILDHRIENPRFKQFYNYFGTSGCKAKNYREGYLLEAWGNDSKEDKLRDEVYRMFKPGDRYSLKDLKKLVGNIYIKLGITKSPKATDLGKYFKLTKTSITTEDKKVVSGFKLEAL